MALKIVILRSAEHDLKELRTYIVKNFSPSVWQSTYAKLKESIHHLQNFPNAGSLPDEIEKLNLSQYRQILSGLNRIIYEVRQDTIFIHIIVDARRDMHTLLAHRLLRIT